MTNETLNSLHAYPEHPSFESSRRALEQYVREVEKVDAARRQHAREHAIATANAAMLDSFEQTAIEFNEWRQSGKLGERPDVAWTRAYTQAMRSAVADIHWTVRNDVLRQRVHFAEAFKSVDHSRLHSS
jgi:hypothetical protein